MKNQADPCFPRTRMAARGTNTSTAIADAKRAPRDMGTGPYTPSPTVDSIVAAMYRAEMKSVDSSGSASEISWWNARHRGQNGTMLEFSGGNGRETLSLRAHWDFRHSSATLPKGNL